MLRLLETSSGDISRAAPSVQVESASVVESPRGRYRTLRDVADFAIALALLVMTLPVIAIAAIGVRVTSRGPVFYTQTRLGLLGRTFRIFKLRSMYQCAESRSGPLWSSHGDPRITPIGRLLRRTHIDELPQLWNVLRGDMSLIGPRPERPEFLAKLERTVPRYRERLRVRPGVTGLAQVQLPPDSDVADVRRKQAYDLYYIEAVNFWLDLRILLCTPLKICNLPYPVLSKIFALPSEARVQRSYRASRPSLHDNSDSMVEVNYLSAESPNAIDAAVQVQPA